MMVVYFSHFLYLNLNRINKLFFNTYKVIVEGRGDSESPQPEMHSIEVRVNFMKYFVDFIKQFFLDDSQITLSKQLF